MTTLFNDNYTTNVCLSDSFCLSLNLKLVCKIFEFKVGVQVLRFEYTKEKEKQNKQILIAFSALNASNLLSVIMAFVYSCTKRFNVFAVVTVVTVYECISLNQ